MVIDGFEVLAVRHNSAIAIATAAQFEGFSTIRTSAQTDPVTLILANTGASTVLDLSDELAIVGGCARAVHLTGPDEDDNLTGRAGNNTISGGDGNDSLIGGSGHDALVRGTGNNVLMSDGDGGQYFGRAGADEVRLTRTGLQTSDGGADLDTISFADRTGTQFFDMETGATNGAGTCLSCQRVIMGSGDDTFSGTAVGDQILGDLARVAAGRDQVFCGGGDDLFAVAAAHLDDIFGGSEDGTGARVEFGAILRGPGRSRGGHRSCWGHGPCHPGHRACAAGCGSRNRGGQ